MKRALMIDRACATQQILAIAGVAAGYWLGSAVGTILSVPPSGFAIIWPTTAFLVAIFMVTPPSRWWIFLCGIVPTHFLLAAIHQPGAPLVVVLSQVFGNLVLAAATVIGLNAANKGQQRFDTSSATMRFILLAAIVIPAIGNALILCLHLATGWTEHFWLSWRQWMLASIFPAVTIPPAFLAAFSYWTSPARKIDAKAATELALLCLTVFAATYVMLGWDIDERWSLELVLASLPVLLWTAVRFGPGATSLALLVFAAALISRALQGHGPFAARAEADDLIALQVFLIGLSIPILLLSSLTQERRDGAERLKQSEERIDLVATSTETGLWYWDDAARQFWMTQYCRSLLQIAPDTKVTRRLLFDLIHEEDRERVRAAMGPAIASSRAETVVEFRIPDAKSEDRWFVLRARPHFDEHGKPIGVSGVFRDITSRVNAREESRRLDHLMASLQEEERKKIAEELHENTAQHLVAVRLSLSALQRQNTLNDGAGRLVDEIRASINHAADELRTFTYLLSPAGLDRAGLCAVLQRYVDGFARRTGLNAALTPSAEADRLPLRHQRAILRIVQESLANAHRHAGATRVSVQLRRMNEALHIVISDDGEGIDQTALQQEDASRTSVGIPGMTALVNQLSGSIAIRSRASGGVVHVVIPIADDRALLAM